MDRPAVRVCPAPGCEEEIPSGLFACRKDWGRLPVALRNRVNRTWSARLRSPQDPELVKAHEEAKDGAVAWYEYKDGVDA